MPTRVLFVVYLLLGFALSSVCQTNTVTRWGRYEVALKATTSTNPYTNVSLTAVFTNGSKTVRVNGFYDGGSIYKIRFMPAKTGTWRYITSSNIKALAGKKGSFTCMAAGAGNHGMVRVWNTYNFKYDDGKVYYPFGTTAYAWTHQPEQLEQQTLASLKNSGFNKIRMCVFPKYYNYVTEDPALYPYQGTASKKDSSGRVIFTWDFKRLNPEFFKHLEKRIDDLAALGIEADVIIFHPYDKGRWGFDSMGRENDLLYIKYLVARLSSFRNVWWSMANEYDYIKSKPREVWDTYAAAVVSNDPYRHLCSIHNGSIYYDNWKPYFTHLSVQNGSAVNDFGKAVLLRDAFFKPVIYDEVCYEGNLPLRWGNLTGQQMTEAVWQGVIAGTYVTHGESIRAPGDTIFWAKGGRFKGQSPARIAFLRKIMEAGPGALHLADAWKDDNTSQTDSTYYLVYLGKQTPHSWKFSLPKKNGPPAGSKYKVDVIDTWNMSITPANDVFETAEANSYRIFDKQAKSVPLPGSPYMALRITMLNTR